MIDLEKLRSVAILFNAEEAKALLAEIDKVAQLEKDAGRLDWMEKQGRVCIERVREGHVKGPLRWDVEHGYNDNSAKSKEGIRQAIDTAMESNHG